MKKFLFLFCIVFNLLTILHSYAESSASIENLTNNTTDFTTDDILELKVVTDQTDNNQIDLSALNNNFEIISQSKQVYHSIINGNTSSKIQWLISLKPKHTGTVIIPKLKFGNEYTNSIELIIKEPYIDPNKAQEIFIIVEASNQEAYVNSPLNIDIKIYVSTDITVRDLNLITPDNSTYSIFKISDSKKRTFYKNRRYDLFNVTYLAFYKTTGTLEIPKFQLTGHKLNNNKTNDLFSLYQQQWHPFNKENAAIPINILPLPVKTDIAADSLTITQEWSNNTPSFEEGDALQRTVTITGTNVLVEQLPAIFAEDDLSSNPNFKHYIDKPERSNSVINNTLISKITQKITYIPISTGKMTLPDKTITWWSNKEHKLNSSIINGREFNIITNSTSNPSSNTNNNLNNNINTSNNNIADNPVKINGQLDNNIINKTTISNDQNSLIYFLSFIILVLTLCIIILIIKINKNKHKNISKQYSNNNNKLFNKHINELKKHARNNNAMYTYKALNIITNIIHPNDSNSVHTFKANLPKEAKMVVDQLSEALYGNNNTGKPNWNSNIFIEVIIPYLNKKIKTHNGTSNTNYTNDAVNVSRFSDIYSNT